MSKQEGSGGMERRIAERVDVSVQVHWSRMSTARSDALRHHGSSYSGVAAVADASDVATEESLERQAYTENLSTMGLKLVGDLRLSDGSALKPGWQLLVVITVPGEKDPIRTIAEVMWVTPPEGPPPRQAGLLFEAINKKDVERVVRIQAAAKRDKER